MILGAFCRPEGFPAAFEAQAWEKNRKRVERPLAKVKILKISGCPGRLRNVENPSKIAKKAVRQADRFTKLVLGGSGGDFSCFFEEIRWNFHVFLVMDFL